MIQRKNDEVKKGIMMFKNVFVRIDSRITYDTQRMCILNKRQIETNFHEFYMKTFDMDWLVE